MSYKLNPFTGILDIVGDGGFFKVTKYNPFSGKMDLTAGGANNLKYNPFAGRFDIEGGSFVGATQAEVDALQAFYEATGGDNWTNNTGWFKYSNVGAWFGVTVFGGHVTEIILQNNNLIGAAASTLSPLVYLDRVYINTNAVTSLDTSALISVRFLLLNGNPGLTVFDGEFNVLLDTLYCYSTGITAIDTTTNTLLTDLRFNDANVSTYDNLTTPLLEDLYADDNSVPAFDFSNLLAAATLQCQDNLMIEAEVDATILSVYTNRASYTNATPLLNIGGTNAVPSVTGLNQIIELTTDPAGEGTFNLWTVVYSGTLGAEKTTNGDMELDSNWADYNFEGGETNERSSTKAHSGTYSRHLILDGANEGCNQNTFSFVSGSTYLVSGWVWIVSGAFRPRAYDGVTVFYLTPVTTIGSWVYWQEYFLAGNTTAVGQIQLISSAGAAEFYADDVSTKEIS